MAATLAQPALPLQRYQLFHTRDVDQAREAVARIFCPHGLTTTRPGAALDARHHSALLHRDVRLNYVQYGAGVDIEPGYLGDFYLLQAPLRGGATVRCGNQEVAAHRGMASLPSPTERLSMRWEEDSPHLIVRFTQAALQRQLQQLAQAPLHGPLVFGLGLALDAPALAPVLNFVQYLCSTLDSGGSQAGGPPLADALAQQAEQYLLSSLLLLAPHNHSQALAAEGQRKLLPRAVRRAQDFMQGHLAEPVSLAQLCSELGVSARALQTAFREHTGQSPMAYWRGVRLDRVRAALQSSGEAERATKTPASVCGIAADHGFLHLGHFAAHYHERFGETPLQTLQASRGRRLH